MKNVIYLTPPRDLKINIKHNTQQTLLYPSVLWNFYGFVQKYLFIEMQSWQCDSVHPRLNNGNHNFSLGCGKITANYIIAGYCLLHKAGTKKFIEIITDNYSYKETTDLISQGKIKFQKCGTKIVERHANLTDVRRSSEASEQLTTDGTPEPIGLLHTK